MPASYVLASHAAELRVYTGPHIREILMKKLLLLCSALALAGCSSSPSTGDIEKFLEPQFASCDNVKVTHVKKTNGYEEDGHYRVEFTYDIELKDPDTLKRMRQTYEEERDLMKAWEDAGKADQQQIATLKAEILTLRKEHNSTAPRREDFSFNNTPGMGFLEEDAYRKALVQWENEHPLPDSLRQKVQALDELEHESRQKQERNQPKNTIFGKVKDSVWSMYIAGCPNGGSTKLFYPALFQIYKEAAKAQDVLYWLQKQQLQMKGKITMRKTENGWRALSEG